MSLLIKSHVAEVYASSPTIVGGNLAVGLDYLDVAVTVRGQLTPERPSTIYESYGIELKKPHIWMCDVADAVHFSINSKVVIGSRTFRVQIEPEVWDAELSTSFAQCVLEEWQGNA